MLHFEFWLFCFFFVCKASFLSNFLFDIEGSEIPIDPYWCFYKHSFAPLIYIVGDRPLVG